METLFNQAALLERQAQRESNARTYPRALPLAIAHARGVDVWDVDGRQYLDFFAGAGALALGHNHPCVVEAVRQQLEKVVHTLDFPTPTRDAFVSELLSIIPERLRQRARVHICAPTGSDAVEAAIKLCKFVTGRNSVIAFYGSYHGMTAGALAVTSLRSAKERVGGLMPQVHFTPFGDCVHCALGLERLTCEVACATLFESALTDPLSGITLPAAVIIEVVQGEGGSNIPARRFIQRVRAASKRAKVVLIADEIQSGLGRTGKWFAFEHFDIVPDVIVVSKALGGAGLPISAIIYDKSLDLWEPGTHIGTFRGHQLAMAAGIAALRTMRELGVIENAQKRGDQLLEGIRQTASPIISNARGLGLMLGIDFCHPDTGEPSASIARAVRRACFDRGLLCELGGRNDTTLRLIPPLIVTEQQVDSALHVLVDAIAYAQSTTTRSLRKNVV